MAETQKPIEEATASELSEVPTKSAAEFLNQADTELRIRLNLRQEYEQLFKMWKDDEFASYAKKQDEVIAEGLKKYFAEWVEQQKPPEPDDIQKLLDQEYVTFHIKVQYFDDEYETKSEMFTIRELPQSVEKKFYKQFREKIIDKLQHLEAITQSEIDKPFEDKAKAFLTLVDESFDMLSEAVVLCLNPFGKKKINEVVLTTEWVQNNISSDRQWRIIEAQMKVNRLRDFFSKVSTSGQQTRMMMRPNFQALQQLVA